MCSAVGAGCALFSHFREEQGSCSLTALQNISLRCLAVGANQQICLAQMFVWVLVMDNNNSSLLHHSQRCWVICSDLFPTSSCPSKDFANPQKIFLTQVVQVPDSISSSSLTWLFKNGRDLSLFGLFSWFWLACSWPDELKET